MIKYKNITISKISNSAPMLSTKQQIVYNIYSNEELVSMTKELTDSLRKNRTIDWQKKGTARADMLRKIKHLLKKYHYPPEEAANVQETVIKQCEQWTDNENKRIILQK
ncbi:type I restriction enzyme endonuclease domain-containing protein [Segatella buccae]|uniref:type I restriction enzyme endonuclease domain-containing protein n=1 Tax=Segatella buccae TaxID=28126 RepID=UPI001E329E4B|nr:type I restriction enzyme endonuclease domain-containing protein [Segatella buccae]